MKPPAMTDELTGILDELEQLLAESRPFLGKQLVNEEKFFVITTRLKAALPRAFNVGASGNPHRLTGTKSSLRLIDEFEHLVETSPSIPLSAMSAVNGLKYQSLLNQIRASLTVEIEAARQHGATSVDDRERSVADAKAEAERIIQEAHREAERILTDAREQARQIGKVPALTLPDNFPDTPNRL